MQAIVFDEPGDEGVLRLAEVPAPRPGPGELLLEVRTTAVNRADVYQRQGQYPPPPGASPILGLECAGIVSDIGREVEPGLIGRRVMALLPGGGYAEQAVVHAGSVLPVPESYSWEEAGAFPEVFLTAWLNIFRLGSVRRGERVLVHGGGSGVGTAALALGRLAGLRLFVTAGSAEKCRRCRELGAEAAFDYHADDWPRQVAEASQGIDVILDPIGARYLEAHLGLLGPGGRLVIIGGQGGVREAPLDVTRLLARRITLIGSTLRARPVEEKAAIVSGFREQFGAALERGEFRPVIDSVFPLVEAAPAHRRLAAGEHFGKIGLRVRPTD